MFYNLILFCKVIIILLLLPSYCFSQSYKSQNDIEDSIQYYSEQLTGKWELVAIYNNELFIETTLYTSFNGTEGFKSEQVLTDTGIIRKNYLNDSLISIEKPNIKDVIEMGYLPDGTGYFQHFPDYDLDSNIQILYSCQPIPQIIFTNNKYVIHFISMSEYDMDFTILEDSLILYNKDNIIKEYIRFKN